MRVRRCSHCTNPNCENIQVESDDDPMDERSPNQDSPDQESSEQDSMEPNVSSSSEYNYSSSEDNGSDNEQPKELSNKDAERLNMYALNWRATIAPSDVSVIIWICLCFKCFFT